MRALDPEVVDAVWAAVEPLIPAPPQTHPLGCHRPRVADRLCLWGMLIRLVTGCSWVSAEAILGHQVSDTTLRDPQIRRTVLAHATLSYVFGVVIVAGSVNLISGLFR